MATGVGAWSTTAGDNDDSDSDINWQEGQAPSTVNGSARAMMAKHKTLELDGGWISFSEYPVTYASATTVTIATDVTGANLYPVGRRVRAVAATPGTIYGRISASSYSAPNTTLTFVWDSGSLSNEALTLSVARLSPKATGVLVGTVGTTTSDSAASGYVGEYVSSTLAAASAISLTTGVTANVISVPLSPGDWDVWGQAVFGGQSGTTLSVLTAYVNTTSATSNSAVGSRATFTYNGSSILNLEPLVLAGPTRMSLSATTTAYLVAAGGFSGGTCSAFGVIHARRVR